MCDARACGGRADTCLFHGSLANASNFDLYEQQDGQGSSPPTLPLCDCKTEGAQDTWTFDPSRTYEALSELLGINKSGGLIKSEDEEAEL